MSRYVFSGHESFQCKSLWLKKGYDFVKGGHTFTEESAVVQLGVGRNMVISIKHWLRAFGIIDDSGATTEIGDFIFGENGRDPFIEDISTKWFLHYQLISTDYASLYKKVFIDLHKERKEFSKSNVHSFIKRQFSERKFENTIYNENTIEKDISTLLKNYVFPRNNKVYEDFATLLIDLNLISRLDRELYSFNYTSRVDTNPFIFLFALKDKAGVSKVVEYDLILEVGLAFCMSANDIQEAFEILNRFNPNITFDNSAGEQLFSINLDVTKFEILDWYYQAQR